LVLGFSLVLKVGILELVADINASLQNLSSLTPFESCDEIEDLLTVDFTAADSYDGIADLYDENNKSGWSVVVLGIGPNKQDSLHNWNKDLSNVFQRLGWISELIEQIFKCFEVLVVFIGFILGDVDFLLELGEWTGVGRFVLLQEFENLLDSFGGKLVADRGEILTLILPEIDFN